MANMKRAIRWAPVAAALCLAQPAWAMDFRLSDHVIHGTGDIAAGDADRLAAFLKTAAPSEPGANDDDVLQLSGGGGDVAAAMQLGRALRAAQISTLVTHDAACLGACALAFLGGTQTYVTGVGIGRVLDYGGKLDFRGIPSVPLAVLAGYADELRGIDVGRLALLAGAQGDEPGVVNQPRDILALSIDLRGFPSKTPADWSVNACVTTVAKRLPALDDPTARV